MKKPTAQDLELCRLQGTLFEQSPELCACSSPVFVRRFMNSGLAARFDSGSVLFESSTLQSMAAELDGQYGPSSYGRIHYDSETLYWMGYLYRYWNVAFGLASKLIYRLAPASELAALYGPYHTLDPQQAIERICEAKGVAPGKPEPSEGYVQEGVALLRRMHERPSYEYYVIEF